MKRKGDAASAAQKTAAVGIWLNLVLCVFKLFAGTIAHSGAMISDAVHSGSDVAATGIALWGIRTGQKAMDREHPYGHDRFESIASLLLAFVLAVTGVLLGLTGVRHLINREALAVPGVLALVAAVVSVVVKEWMYHHTMRVAKALDSVALKAAAWDHRSDALSSVGSFVGILGARLGLPVLDPIASLLICLFILKAAVTIFLEAVDKTVDKACPSETEDRIKQAVLSESGVVRIDLLKTRQFAAGIYVDVEIAADGSLTLSEAHEIAEAVHNAVERAEPHIRHCMVHVNPAEAGSTKE